MTNSTVDLSVVIVTWNAKKYIGACLSSIQEQSTCTSMETIVVDNHSSDGTPDMVRKDYPGVILIENDSNLGFARANNVGIRISRGKCLFLINPDVIVLPHCLERLAAHINREPSIGLAGPRMLAPNGSVQRSTMRFPTPWNSICRALALDRIFKGSKTFGGFLMSDFQHDRIVDVDILNGWFWAARREAVDRVGLLDETLFMYGDDLDWSYRFHECGYRVVFCADAEAIHYGGGTTAKAPTFFYIERQRANIQFWRKYYSPFQVGLYLGSILLNEVIRVVGYCVVFVFNKGSRNDASAKIRRSVALLAWFVGLRSNRTGLA